MILYASNILTLPLLIAIFVIDGYLILAGLCWLIGAVNGQDIRHNPTALQRLVERPIRAVEARLTGWCSGRVRRWGPWIIVLVTALVVRQTLALIVIHIS